MLERLSTRGRILLLVIGSALPMIALSIYVALDQRAAVEARAQEELGHRAELVAALLAGFQLEALPQGGAAALGRGQMVTILNPAGTVIAQYPPMFARAGDRFPNRAVLAALARGQTAFDEADPSGVRRLYAARKVPASEAAVAGLIVVVSMPKALVHEDTDRALSYTLGGIAAVTILLVLLAWHGAQRLVLSPIRVMLETTRRVRAGDLAARTGLKPTREELSQLGAALDAMAKQLQTHDRELGQALEDLTQQAMTDALTGLYNRRFFWDALTREIAAAKRKSVPFSVILLDIDRFKRVNDTWGHDAGDIVLREVADLLKKSVRGSDIAVRHGGEEFAILLPDTAIDVAAERAESLRRELESHEIKYDLQRVRITASFGAAQYGPCTGDPASLMKAVDAAMYAAKAAGRNRVVVSELPGPLAQLQSGNSGTRPVSIATSPASPAP